MFKFHLSVAVGALALLPLLALGDRGFLCERLWTGPNKNNDLVGCLANTNHLLNTYLLTPERLGPLIVGLLCVVFGLFCPLVYCCFVTCRYCCNCCGGRSRRPDGCCCGDSAWDDKTEEEINAGYEPNSVRCAKGCAFGVAVLTISAVVVTLIGGILTISAYGTAFDNAGSVLDWALEKKNFISTTMHVQDADNVTVLVPPMTESMFTNMQTKITDFKTTLSNLRAQGQPYIEYVNIVAICVATVPFGLIVITILCAIFNIRSVLLFINSFFHMLFIMVYGILGGFILVISIFLVDIEGERQKLLNGQPGLFLWSLAPSFDDQAPFAEMSKNVQASQKDNSIAACDSIQGIATSQYTSYRSTAPKVVYQWNVSTPSVDCPNLYAVEGAVGVMQLFVDSPNKCTDVADSDQRTQCTLSRCAKTCSDQSVKNSSKTATNNLKFARAAYSAFDILLPLLQFAIVFKELMQRLPILQVLADAFTLTGVGLCLFCIFFIFDMFVIFRGQKRFFALPDPVEELQPGEAGADGRQQQQPQDQYGANEKYSPSERPQETEMAQKSEKPL